MPSANVPPAYVVRLEPRHFDSCQSAAAALRGAEAASFRASLSFQYDPIGSERDGQIAYALTLTLAEATIVLPDWSWPLESPEQRDAWQKFRDALANHEMGHFEIARSFVDSHGRSTVTLPAYLLQRDVQADFAQRLSKLEAAVRARQDAYDSVTAHGMVQSQGTSHGFRGGADIMFSCP